VVRRQHWRHGQHTLQGYAMHISVALLLLFKSLMKANALRSPAVMYL
jgi:hypothetical protein